MINNLTSKKEVKYYISSKLEKSSAIDRFLIYLEDGLTFQFIIFV